MTLIVSTAEPTSTTTDLPAAPAPELGGPVKIWTDGSCRPNPGAGGWAAILQGPNGAERPIKGSEPDTTNNRMELRAAIQGLKALKRPCRVTVIGDSEYVSLGMTAWVPKWIAAGWRTAKGRPVENRDLWEELVAAAGPHDVTWQWTRGHASDAMNNRADALANAAREKMARQQASRQDVAGVL